MHRILVARRPIAAGEALTTENLGLKRPLEGVTGLPPAAWEQTLGRRVGRDLAVDEAVTAEVLQ